MENEFSRGFDAFSGLVWTALPDGKPDFLNQRWLDYSGLSFEEACGLGWQATIHPEDLQWFIDHWRFIVYSGDSGEMEVRLRRFHEEYRWFLISSNPMRDEAGRFVKWYGFNPDIEDRRRAEDALRQRDLSFQLIVDSIPVPVAVRTPSGEVEGLNRMTLEYFGKTFEELKGWTASEVVHPDDLPHTIAAQLAAHVANASESMSGIDDRPRQLTVKTGRVEGDCVRLAVEDAGVGIDPHNVEKLFDAFYTTKGTGMGMGLSVSRSTVEAHHGRLWAAPHDGPGSMFSFSIPSTSEAVTGTRNRGAVRTSAVPNAAQVMRES